MTTDILKRKLNGYVGFHHLPNQIHRKSLKKGFTFTLMLVGESGLGKSTLINSLFNTQIHAPKDVRETKKNTGTAVTISSTTTNIEENGVKLTLNVIDTPGFGDFLNNENSWKPILEDVQSRFDSYLEQESRVHRKKFVDTRVHACIYFIAPTGHSLKPLDIEFMKRLGSRVNLIPVIAKADTMTEDEMKLFKQRVLEDIATNQINIYIPPIYDNDDPETIKEITEIKERMPFAVVGSTQEFEMNGKKVRGRKYPWGVIEVDNEDHCDFVKLRQMLIRSHMEELKEHTNQVLYENYRTEKLTREGSVVLNVSAAGNPLEDERRAHELKIAKMESEMQSVFQQKVNEKEAKLKASEEELYARHKEMKDQLLKQRLELEEKKRRLESSAPGTPKKGKGLFKH